MLKKRLSNWFKSLLSSPKDIQYLKNFPILSDLNNHELYLFSKLLQERHYKKGEYIYKEDFPLAVVYLVKSGTVEVCENIDILVEPFIIRANEFIGIVDMYDLERRKGKAKALEDTVLLAISKEDFHSYNVANPHAGVKILNNICRILSHQIYEMIEKLSEKEEK